MKVQSINAPKWPRLLSSAIISGTKVAWPMSPDLRDEDIVEYMSWKGVHKIDVLKTSHLRKMHGIGLYVSPIFNLFKRSNKINYLEKATKNMKVE